jgi:hypothetical protein
MENNGLSLSAIVFVVLLTLKLSGVIDWSWWWITLPLWWMIPLVLLIIIFALIVIVFEEMRDKIREQE